MERHERILVWCGEDINAKSRRRTACPELRASAYGCLSRRRRRNQARQSERDIVEVAVVHVVTAPALIPIVASEDGPGVIHRRRLDVDRHDKNGVALRTRTVYPV